MGTGQKAIRLNKYIAQCGAASRRGADDLVFGGRVYVNNQKADSPGIKVIPGEDEVRLDDSILTPPCARDGMTILLHKPVQTVTTASDPQGRKTVLELLPEEIRELRPFPVGRLDFFSEGLLLLTTDGDLCHRLTHPKWHLPKTYEVTIREKVSHKALQIMRSGMTLKEGEKLAPVDVKSSMTQSGNHILTMTMIQGVNRQIRRMCRDLGLTILKLRRTKQGPVTLGRLPKGNWRELSSQEIKKLKKAVGLH